MLIGESFSERLPQQQPVLRQTNDDEESRARGFPFILICWDVEVGVDLNIYLTSFPGTRLAGCTVTC